MTIKELVSKRKNELEKILNRITQRLEKGPEGKIRIVKHGQSLYFYYVPEGKNNGAKYISKEDSATISSFLQKRYDQMLYQTVKSQLREIVNFEKKFNENAVSDVLLNFDKQCIEYIEAFEYPAEMYADFWQKKEYKGNPYPFDGNMFLTAKNERVRSKSEVIIANCLKEAGIPYRYECPMHLNGSYIIYPDFTLLNKATGEEVIWEHFGKMDDPKYRKRAYEKLEQMTVAGIIPKKKLILTFEDYENPLSVLTVKQMIKSYLE